MANIIDCMRVLNYPTDSEGVCLGLALMAERARQCGEFAIFKERMDYIKKIEIENLIALIASAEEQNRKLRDNQEVLQLTKEEKILLTLKSFFFQIWAYFDPQKIKEFLELKEEITLDQYNRTIIENLTYDESSPHIALSPLPVPDKFIFSASNEDDYKSLQLLLTKIKSSNLSVGIVLISGEHAIHLFYDYVSCSWVVTNHSELDEFTDMIVLIDYLIKKFTKNKVAHLGLHVFSHEVNKKIFVEKLKSICDESIYNYIYHKNDVDSDGNTLLMQAAIHGDTNVIKQLIAFQKIKVNKKNKLGRTALLLAIEFGRAETVKMLLEKRQDIDINYGINGKTLTPLALAASFGFSKIVTMLLQHAGEKNIEITSDAETALLYAGLRGKIECVELLLNSDYINLDRFYKDLNELTDEGLKNIPLFQFHETIIDAKNLSIIKENLLKLKSEILIFAAKKGKVKLVKKILEDPTTNANQKKLNSETALIVAARNGHAKVIKVLRESNETRENASYQANINLKTQFDVSPLFLASRNDHPEAVKELLLFDGVNINTVTNGVTPLYIAVQEGKLEVVEALLADHRIDVDLQSHQRTPLYIAVEKGNELIAAALLEKSKISINQGSEKYCSLLINFAKEKNEECGRKLSQLLENEIKKIENFTPLHAAVFYGNKNMVSLLLQNGANLAVTAKIANKEITISELANAMGDHEIIDLLVGSTHHIAYNSC